MDRASCAVAVVLAMTTSVGVAAEPKVLADFELDGITAAGVAVDVSSFAAALGDATRTHTDARTWALDGQRLDLGFGFTLGRALACCGQDADVEVGSAVAGAGDIVRGSTQAVKNKNSFFAHGLSAGFVVALSFDRPLAIYGERHPALSAIRSGHAAATE